MSLVRGVHHVAYRCKNAKQTVEWYKKYLDMDFILAIAENQVPSTKEPDPYMHIFLDVGGGNILAFFELPTKPEMIAPSDANTPAWTQHLALKVDSVEAMMAAKARMEADGIQVVGPTDHTLFQSIYFRDPSGHRLELAADTTTPQMSAALEQVKWDMLDEWDRTKQAPQHARWMHDGSGTPT
ncbi:lactoylglutathione lyase [Oryzisolibacter propanilivorax]|uniref:Lactoylglutathione lyase n=1 Tax=Oryzisolibacter propanilivorax TaxID=1527607 RepID=A0A1G9T319_9BURK|nr:VOC family protein [Oryzisolibacter propanilivorax]SDM41475.1 lactoylglutathione lyase [Oryzisolibacter propanilivorax]